MAKHWFTTLPSNYFMRQSRKGGRREILFTTLALGLAHFGLFEPLRKSYYQRGVLPVWERSVVNGQPWTV
ncbi:unnamed protein product [Paramecium octaurelia]|uniref:Uncharacterized protein n=1 Tax=Paramecium octaurelia TaxID=43137 RepID=A0A8S1YEY9_PAROT|nr:unnamed protein product [Paramecium octaurelia]